MVEPAATSAASAARTSATLARFAPFVWLVPCLLAVVAYRCVVDFDFVADARMLILDNRFLHDPAGAWAQVGHDYFWSSSGSIIPYWRPLTKLSWWCEWQLFGAHAGPFLLANLAWHALGVAGLWRLARDLGAGRWAASLTATVYALHPVAIEPVALLMARSDVVAATGVVWSVVAWRRWMRAAERREGWVWLLLHLGAMLAALASKEVAVITPAVLAAWALAEPVPSRPARARLARVLPGVAVVAAYALVRRHVLAAEHPDLPATSLDLRPLRAFASTGLYLWNTWPLALRSSVRDVSLAEARGVAAVARALVAGAGLAWLAVRAWRRDRASLALLAWALAALAPVVLVRDISVPTGADKLALADRWLHHALGPALLVWSRAVDALARAPVARRAVLAATVAWAAWMLARSTPDRVDLGTELRMLDNEDRAFFLPIPEEYRTSADACRFEERRVARALLGGAAADALTASQEAARVCGRTPERVADLLDATVRAGRYREAAALADEALAHPPHDPRGHARLAHDAGLAYLATSRPADAERWLAKAVSLGAAPCAMPWVPLAEAARARGDVAEAATRAENAYACGGREDPSLLIAAATWLVEGPRDDARATRLLAQATQHRLAPDQAAQAQDLVRRMRAR